MRNSIYASLVVVTTFVLTLSGCTPPETTNTQAMPTPQVSVAPVISQRITEWDQFTGRLEATERVELRPRVSGYIEQVVYEEGSIVKAGQPLFIIDSRSFQAEVNRLTADLESARSRFKLADLEYQRAKKLIKQRAIATEVLDNRRAMRDQAKASIASMTAALDLARLNSSYTRVTAPISGRISRAKVTAGNHVSAGQSILTTIVSTNKMYAYFEADEQTYLKYMHMDKSGDRRSSRKSKNPVYMALANDIGFPHEGYIDFVDNQVDPTTGTIRGRAVFDNRENQYTPGLFARLRLIGSVSYDGILIDDKAIGTDLNNKFVLVLDKDQAVQYRSIVLGEKLAGLRIIKSGLASGEKIVVNGLQRVFPGSTVKAEIISMAKESTLQNLQAMQQRVDQATDEYASGDVKVSKIFESTAAGQ